MIKFNNNILTAGRDRLIKAWDKSTGQKNDEFSGHKNSILSLLKLNQNTLLSASRDQVIKIWKERYGKFYFQKDLKIHGTTVLTLCKVDDSTFISGGADGIINVVEENGKVILSWNGHSEWIWQIIKINETEICSIGEDGLLKIWNYKTGSLLKHFQCDYPINSIAFAKETIFIGNSNGEIQLLFWEREICNLIVRNSFQGHQGIIRQLKLFNGFLLSGGEDSKVKIWNTVNMKCIQIVEHNNFVQDFIIEKDTLISVSYDGQILKTKLNS